MCCVESLVDAWRDLFQFFARQRKKQRCRCQEDRLSVKQMQSDIQTYCPGRISPVRFLSGYFML